MGLLGWLRVLISIHALLAESDAWSASKLGGDIYFYPRSPCGERPPRVLRHCTTYLFLSTLSLRRATAAGRFRYLDNIISIHALLAESDICQEQRAEFFAHFYPRSPCGERLIGPLIFSVQPRFLSTLSLRRATSPFALLICPPHDFYPRSPCGERLLGSAAAGSPTSFLSTLSLRRATGAISQLQYILGDFYPRSPCGERHLRVVDGSKSSIISIHALLAESDACLCFRHFAAEKFLSTLSLRRATSTHALPSHIHTNFYPRSPCGERRHHDLQ